MKTKITGGKFVKKYWQYLFWLGPILAVAGLSAGAVSGEWVPVPLGLIISGLVIIGWWVIYQVSSTQGFWSRRSTEVGTNALISTLSIAIILGLINFLGYRYFLRFDLTENQQLTLAPQSERVVQNLDRPVKIWIFSPQKSGTDVTLLDNYQRLSDGNFSYEYVDLQKRPALAEQFNVNQLGDMFLETGDRQQLLQNIQTEGISETTLTNRLAQLSSAKQPTAYFVQGHGEQPFQAERGGISAATQALEGAGYAVESLNLTQRSGIPDDATLVVVAGPTSKLFESEVKALQAYLDGGGNLLVAIDPNSDSGLQPLLDDWGIRTDDRFAVDPDRWVEGFGPQAPLVIDYGEHPITQDFGEDYSLYPLVRSFEIEDIEGVDAAPLLFTSDASWAESNLDQGPEWKFDITEDGDIKPDRRGPLVLGVALNREVQVDAVQTSDTDQNAEESETSDAETTETETTEEFEIAESEISDSEVTETETTQTEPTEESKIPESDAAEVETLEESAATETELTEESETAESEAAEVETLEESAASETEGTETEAVGMEPTEESETAESETDVVENENNTASPEAPETPDARTEDVPKESRLIVLGDSDFFTNGLFEQIPLNGDMFVNSVNWLSQENEELLSIRPREPNNRTLPITPKQARILMATIAIFPVMGLTASGLIWWGRR
ncbi:Gldg family protein [Oscillatoriales cyanobacterium LEGE 11467]|uniref:Gldg family protein n=1 Tax=Zarconia navalis LEGE 11467 TaxID=1828826 RepID=A0A928VX30_9CYAN|nr:Gldg family protein [Zarconia navalis]MBE9040337.1 Gldg family protein [Zarconia navalis LEGE 11467]